jgi:hypothetical protein
MRKPAATRAKPRLLSPADMPEIARELGVVPKTSWADPAAERAKIMAVIGPELTTLKDLVFGNHVLVAKWIRTRVSNSILAAAKTQTEDRWQGKIGLVLAVGPSAFVDDANYSFHGVSVATGDWVWYSMADGTDQDYCPPGTTDKLPCRTLKDFDIIGRVPRPDFFY